MKILLWTSKYIVLLLAWSSYNCFVLVYDIAQSSIFQSKTLLDAFQFCDPDIQIEMKKYTFVKPTKI